MEFIIVPLIVLTIFVTIFGTIDMIRQLFFKK
jgi:hypothetical protein